MSSDRSVEPSPSERVLDGERILTALRAAAREALLLHKQLGHPVVVWKDGRVQWIPPQDLPGPEPTALAGD